MSIKAISAAALVALTLPSLANAATFVGDTAQFTYGQTGAVPLFDVTTTVINPGIEASYTRFDAKFDIDVDATTVTFTMDLGRFASVGANSTWKVLGLDTDDGSLIDGVSLTSGPAADLVGFSFTGDSLTFDFINFTKPPQVRTFEFDISTSIAAVPLPASLPLALLGLGALGMLRRRNQKV